PPNKSNLVSALTGLGSSDRGPSSTYSGSVIAPVATSDGRNLGVANRGRGHLFYRRVVEDSGLGLETTLQKISEVLGHLRCRDVQERYAPGEADLRRDPE